ncbi:MAG: RecQ family ATP-dependent DNA helicase [Nannocystaceae bacterium]|nr:ATP-dependent DNA helicase [bacterium]
MPDASPSVDLDAGLRRFGFEQFRPGQREAMETLLERRRLLLVAPTGGGKSLTYQLPATLLGGTTIVISPLVALMADQVASMSAMGVRATYLAATLPGDEVRARMGAIARGEFDLVYVAPERLAFGGFRGIAQQLNVPLVAVDEAHCISEWGHDFRPEYMQIGDFVQSLPKARLLACTATATPIVRDEILSKLGLPDDTPQIVKGFARPNLALKVKELRYAKERDPHVDAALGEALGSPGGERRGTGIIYAPTRKATQEQARRLEELGWSAAHYHAGMTGSHRDEVQAQFIDGQLDVVVATNAFGMGIDRGDVRVVVHLAPPSSIEAYYQEVGRAGRDGDPALGLLMYTPSDVQLRRRLLERGADGEPTPKAIFEHKWGLFLELMRWAEGGSCRHDAILRYFSDEAETMGGCGKCDACLHMGEESHDPEEVSLIVRKALSGIARVHNRYGLTAASKLLKGNKDPRLERSGLDATRTFGALAEHSEAWITKLLRRCVTAGWADFVGDPHPVVFLTDDGKEVMAGRRPARLVLPRAVEVKGGASKRSGGSGTRSKVDAPDLDEAALEVFEALRKYRRERAKDDGVPPYVVASDRTLRDVALLRPRTLDELGLAHGIGPAKLEKYGEGLLACVAQAQVG